MCNRFTCSAGITIAVVSSLLTGCSKERDTVVTSSTLNPTTEVAPVVGSTTQASSNPTGTDHGYFYQCYVSSGSGTISFPQAGTYPGNFQANWSNVGDIVAGKGWKPGSTNRGYQL